MLVDIDNQIETQTNTLDRKKRDVNHEQDTATKETVIITTNESELNVDRIDAGTENSKRTVRQLRPPPFGQASWQYTNNFGLPNGHQLATTSGGAQQFQREPDLNLNFNPFLGPPPNPQANQFFKNGASSSFFQLPSLLNKQNEFRTFANPYGSIRNTDTNAVTEFSGHKPYTVHTSFELDDAQYKQTNKANYATAGSYYPTILSQNPSKSQSKPNTAQQASNVDDLPENYAYYHIGGGGTTKTEREHNRPAGSHRQNQQTGKLSVPQPPVYYLEKPSKAISASTPKNHYIQFSTVGGFFNNNPASYAPIDNNYKKHKARPVTEKYALATHRPLYRDRPAPVHENAQTDDAYYNIQNTDILPYFTPVTTPHTATTKPKAHSHSKNTGDERLNKNGKQQSSALYAYQVNIDDLPSTGGNKNSGFYITQSSNENKNNFKDYTTTTKGTPTDWKTTEILPSAKRPNIAGPQVGVDFDFNKFIYNIRESQRAPNARPAKYSQRPVQLESIPLKTGGKTTPQHSIVQTEATTLQSDDYYYYDEDVKTTTAKKPSFSGVIDTFHSNIKPVTQTTSTTVKGSNVNSASAYGKLNLRPVSPVPDSDDDYFEYENEDEYKLPPQNVSKFMPMSETAAPRPMYAITTTRPTPNVSKYTTNSNREYYTKANTLQSSSIAPPNNYADDVLQSAKPNSIPRYLNQTTLRPYTVRTRSKTNHLTDFKTETNSPKVHIKTTKAPTNKILTTYSETPTPTITTTTPTTSRTYTVRKNHGQSDQNRWKLTKAPKQQRPNALKKNLWELDEHLPNRYLSHSLITLITHICTHESSSTD